MFISFVRFSYLSTLLAHLYSFVSPISQLVEQLFTASQPAIGALEHLESGTNVVEKAASWLTGWMGGGGGAAETRRAPRPTSAPVVVVFVIGGITGGELASLDRVLARATRREGGLDIDTGLESPPRVAGNAAEGRAAPRRLLVGGTCVASPTTVADALFLRGE